MKCPVCRNISLITQELETNLQALRCLDCGGHWLPSARYWEWRDAQDTNLPEVPAEQVEPLPVEDQRKAKLCPECATILVPYKVGHNLTFTLDHCGHCSGVWFDRNEWESLRDRNLHDDVHFIFGHVWQTAVVRAERDQMREERLTRTFGEEDYTELKRVKAWLTTHPRCHEMYAFLLDRGDDAAPGFPFTNLPL